MSRAACSGEISAFSDILIFLLGVKLDIECINSNRLRFDLLTIHNDPKERSAGEICCSCRGGDQLLILRGLFSKMLYHNARGRLCPIISNLTD